MEQPAVPMTVQAQVGVRNNMASILHVSDNMPFELSLICRDISFDKTYVGVFESDTI